MQAVVGIGVLVIGRVDVGQHQIGGIISSTALTLLVLPALYRIIHGRD